MFACAFDAGRRKPLPEPFQSPAEPEPGLHCRQYSLRAAGFRGGLPPCARRRDVPGAASRGIRRRRARARLRSTGAARFPVRRGAAALALPSVKAAGKAEGRGAGRVERGRKAFGPAEPQEPQKPQKPREPQDPQDPQDKRRPSKRLFPRFHGFTDLSPAPLFLLTAPASRPSENQGGNRRRSRPLPPCRKFPRYTGRAHTRRRN